MGLLDRDYMRRDIDEEPEEPQRFRPLVAIIAVFVIISLLIAFIL